MIASAPYADDLRSQCAMGSAREIGVSTPIPTTASGSGRSGEISYAYAIVQFPRFNSGDRR